MMEAGMVCTMRDGKNPKLRGEFGVVNEGASVLAFCWIVMQYHRSVRHSFD